MHARERITDEVDFLKEDQELWQEYKKDASLSSKKWRTYRRKRKLALYIKNKNILLFHIKYGKKCFVF